MNRPNVVLIYTDQLRWDALGCMGNTQVRSRNIDELAASAAVFDHHFVQSPVCMPSRVSMLSSQFPSALGITSMGVPVPETLRVLPHFLKPMGYRTANLGKLHFQPHANRDHTLPHPSYGFDVLELSDEPGVYPDAYLAWVEQQDATAVEHVSAGLPPAAAAWRNIMDGQSSEHVARDDYAGPWPFPADESLTHSAFVADRTIDFIRSSVAGGQPFLAIASFFSPHAPHVVPQRFLDIYQPSAIEIGVDRDEEAHTLAELQRITHGYYASISELDEHVGRILAELQRIGIDEETIVVFTSDHGEWLGHHGRLSKGYPADDSVTRVPLIIRGPGISPGTRSTVVEAVDIVPTLLKLTGSQTPSELQGRALFDSNGSNSTASSDSAITEHDGWKSLRTSRYHYLVHDDGHEHLWDLATDPGEATDLASEESRQTVLAELRHELLVRLLQIESTHRPVWPY